MNLARTLRRSGSLLVLALGASFLVGACSGGGDEYGEVTWQCFELVEASAGGSSGSVGGGSSAGGGASVGGSDAAGVPDDSASSASCDCYGRDEGASASDPKPRVNGCDPNWLCCFVWTDANDDYQCRCADPPADYDGQIAGFCASAAAEFGAEVVDACPPTPRDNPTYCAFDGESCDSDYLEQNGLSGCCKELRCGTDAQGASVCLVE